MVADCSAYEDSYQNCRVWCQDIAARLEPCIEVDGDRSVIESRVNRLEELLELTDVGLQRIQHVKDCGARAMSSSSPEGGDVISSSLSDLASSWGKTVNEMTAAKERLEAVLKQRGQRDATLLSVDKELRGVEDELQQLAVVQSTLPEKVARLERAKVRNV